MRIPALIEIGHVVSVDYSAGTVVVRFEDQGNNTSDDLPMLSHEYKMPAKGDPVVCLFLSDGPNRGFCLGKYFNDDNLPVHPGEGVFYKAFSDSAYIKYEPSTNTLTISAGTVNIVQTGG